MKYQNLVDVKMLYIVPIILIEHPIIMTIELIIIFMLREKEHRIIL